MLLLQIYFLAGLQEGLSYKFRVIAENAAGIGKPSDESEYVKAVSIVGMPGAPEIVDMSSQSICLKWKPPNADGGCKIVGYVCQVLDSIAEYVKPILEMKDTMWNGVTYPTADGSNATSLQLTNARLLWVDWRRATNMNLESPRKTPLEL